MEANELRQFSADDLRGRIKEWKEEIFRQYLKKVTSESKDTMVLRRLRRDVARAYTVLNEKVAGIEIAVRPVRAKATRKAASAKEDVAEVVDGEKPKKSKKKKSEGETV